MNPERRPLRSISTRVGLVFALAAACGPLAQNTQAPTSQPTAVLQTPSTGLTMTPAATSASPAPGAEVEFVRWLSRDVELTTEPGGEVFWGTGDHPIAAVTSRTTHNGQEWIRVQYGTISAYDHVIYGWAPSSMAAIGPTHEPFEPTCPEGQPTVGEVVGMMPLQAVHCFGSRALTFTDVQVRSEGSDDGELTEGSPSWLMEGGELTAYWFPEWREAGSIPLYVDPASGIQISEGRWVEVSGHFDDEAARKCNRTASQIPEFAVASTEEAVLLCRGRFVVTDARLLTEAEIPARPPRATPGPEPDMTIDVAVSRLRAPISTRIEATGVWTGSEVIVWGGSSWHQDWDQKPTSDGIAYDPADGTWREISGGPLDPRAGHVAAWTGSEMLVWGGYGTNGLLPASGAAYKPSTDTWRMIDAGPLRPSYQIDSAWTGTEWWVAVTRNDNINVAAYDAEADTWRRIPSPSTRASDGTELIWTGTEMLLYNNNAGLFRMAPSDDEWTAESVAFHGSIVWTGELAIGIRFDDMANEPFDYEPWSYPVAWDPATGGLVEIPLPPRSAWSVDPIWTGRYLAYFEVGLALDVEGATWLDMDPVSDTRTGEVRVWTGETLFVWGGWSGCPGYTDRYDVGYEVLPKLPSSLSSSRLAEGTLPDSNLMSGPVGPFLDPSPPKAC